MKTALEEFDRLVELIIDDAYETEEYKELKKDLDDLGISGEISELIALFNEAVKHPSPNSRANGAFDSKVEDLQDMITFISDPANFESNEGPGAGAGE